MTLYVYTVPYSVFLDTWKVFLLVGGCCNKPPNVSGFIQYIFLAPVIIQHGCPYSVAGFPPLEEKTNIQRPRLFPSRPATH